MKVWGRIDATMSAVGDGSGGVGIGVEVANHDDIEPPIAGSEMQRIASRGVITVGN